MTRITPSAIEYSPTFPHKDDHMGGRHNLQNPYPVGSKLCSGIEVSKLTTPDLDILHDQKAYHTRRAGYKTATEQNLTYEQTVSTRSIPHAAQDREYLEARRRGEVKTLGEQTQSEKQVQMVSRQLPVQLGPPNERSDRWYERHYARRFPAISDTPYVKPIFAKISKLWSSL